MNDTYPKWFWESNNRMGYKIVDKDTGTSNHGSFNYSEAEMDKYNSVQVTKEELRTKFRVWPKHWDTPTTPAQHEDDFLEL